MFHRAIPLARNVFRKRDTFTIMDQSYEQIGQQLSNLAIIERRGSIRFPLELDLSYRLNPRSVEWVSGKAVNISSSGILIEAVPLLIPGRVIHMQLQWPHKLDNRVPLRLVVRGKVVRSGADQAAIMFQGFEFRTVRGQCLV